MSKSNQPYLADAKSTNQQFPMYLTTENKLVLDGAEHSIEQIREGLRLLAMAEAAERDPTEAFDGGRLG
jgi:hypothetical protein